MDSAQNLSSVLSNRILNDAEGKFAKKYIPNHNSNQ